MSQQCRIYANKAVYIISHKCTFHPHQPYSWLNLRLLLERLARAAATSNLPSAILWTLRIIWIRSFIIKDVSQMEAFKVDRLLIDAGKRASVRARNRKITTKVRFILISVEQLNMSSSTFYQISSKTQKLTPESIASAFYFDD